MSKPLRIVKILEGTSVDGPGLRTSVYFAGCEHHCPGCHNPATWPMTAGEDMSIDSVMDIVRYNDFDVTFSGGDPFYQAEAILPLAKEIKACGKTIWCYTGFRFEELDKVPAAQELLEYIDVLIDGPFVESLKDRTLRFRGSANQRLIDLNKSRATGSIILLDL